MYQLKHDVSKSNLQIGEWMKEITIPGKTYSGIIRQQFNPYSSSPIPLYWDYIETMRSEWEEDKEFTMDQVR